jgi:predicted dehydrogenase
VANFTASRVSTETVRKLRFFQPHQYLSIDYARQDLLVIEVAPGEIAPGAPPAAGVAGTPPPSAALMASQPAVESGEPLLLEIQAFLDSVRTRKPPRVKPEEARAALALALEINQAIQAHAERAGLL